MVHISSIISHRTLFRVTSSCGSFTGNLAGVIFENGCACIRAVVNNPRSYTCSYHWHILTLILHSCAFNPEWVSHILIQNLAIYDITALPHYTLYANAWSSHFHENFSSPCRSLKSSINQFTLNRLIYVRSKTLNLSKRVLICNWARA